MNTKLLKQKILDLAIRGKLVPQDPNDEPASELLKRIRAEKEKLIAEGKIKRSKKAGDKPHYENVPFGVPESWIWVRLEEICDKIVDGDHNPPKGLETPTQYLMISSRNINHDRIENLDNVRYLSKEIFEIENERTRLNVGDILFTSVGSLGRSCVYNSCYNLCFQRSVSIIHTLTYNYWVKYFFDSDYYQNLIIKKATGTAQMGFYLQQLSESYIALPPYNEQLRIVSEIEHWFALINDIETNKLELQEFIKQTKSKILDFAIHGKLVPQDLNDEPAIELLKRINPAIKPCDTSHYENLPKSWCVVKLGDIGKWQAGGTPNRGVKEYYGGNIPWLKTGDLNDGFINKIPECITQAGLDNSSAKLNPKDSVLIAMYGATIGKIGILTFPAATNQACCACVDYPLLEKIYLFYFLLSHRDAFIMQGGGGAQPNISKEIILNTEIPLPPINEQKRIAEMITEVFSFLDKISADL